MKTIIIESNFAFERNKRGIGHQLLTWLLNVKWEKHPDVKFILTYFDGKSILNKLPNNVFTKKIKANNFDEYIEKIYNEIDFDLIFFQTAKVKYLKNGIKAVGVNYGMENLYCREYIESFNADKMLNEFEQSFKKYNLIVTVSKTAKKDLSWFFPEFSKKIKLVYTGINPILQKSINIKNNNISKNNFFLIIGYEHKKNITRITSAFNNFKKNTNSTIKLVIIGKPGYGSKQIDSHISSLDYKNEIIKLGYISDNEKTWLLKNCQSLIALPIYEGFGLSALEGLFFNKKVLASDNGSLKEVVGKAGFLANPFDIIKIEKQMTYLSRLNNNPKRKYIEERLEVYDQRLAAKKLIETLIAVL